MTAEAKSSESCPVGRKKQWPERIGAKFAKGTLKRIAAVLDRKGGEVRLDFIRLAIEREIERRERKLKAQKKGEPDGAN